MVSDRVLTAKHKRVAVDKLVAAYAGHKLYIMGACAIIVNAHGRKIAVATAQDVANLWQVGYRGTLLTIRELMLSSDTQAL